MSAFRHHGQYGNFNTIQRLAKPETKNQTCLYSISFIICLELLTILSVNVAINGQFSRFQKSHSHMLQKNTAFYCTVKLQETGQLLHKFLFFQLPATKTKKLNCREKNVGIIVTANFLWRVWADYLWESLGKKYSLQINNFCDSRNWTTFT